MVHCLMNAFYLARVWNDKDKVRYELACKQTGRDGYRQNFFFSSNEAIILVETTS